VTRVLLVHQPVDSGVGRHVRDLTNGLEKQGYEIVLCAPAAPAGALASSTLRRLELQRAVAPRADLAAIATLTKIVHELRPDLVHAHSSKAGAIARLARLTHPGIPLLYTPHGYAFTGHFSHKAERQAYLAVERALAPLASRVVCVCEAEARVARTIGPKSRVRIVHNGVQAAEAGPIDPRIAELSHAGPVIGALTLLRPGKGLGTLIDAMPRILERHPAVQVAIIGEGPELERLRTQAALRGAAHAVHFLGASPDPASMLRGMDVFIHPSWAEAFPYVILEAMSLGRAIVASDVGGVSEALVDGESGLLIPPRDQEAIAIKLISLLDDPDRRTRMGAMALDRQHNLFTATKMIQGTAAIYNEVANDPNTKQ
jgi:glycosyltransferase involved in cell wall biosynthesis